MVDDHLHDKLNDPRIESYDLIHSNQPSELSFFKSRAWRLAGGKSFSTNRTTECCDGVSKCEQ